ncbi:sufE-like protein 1, chloroplastic/mitochondrial [Mercurialis annua]|uniref:sufE-like protein 1, chloroplastic/mitochondrial n=1 Tax=Mercurialis annua TaxID=3986 RepID=UPI00215F00A6|nr:sufE-like protein 1, chloroplastic/mitochondrial [Mercurialis annua]
MMLMLSSIRSSSRSKLGFTAMNASSISTTTTPTPTTSLALFTSKFTPSKSNPNSNLPFILYKPISFQKIPTKKQSLPPISSLSSSAAMSLQPIEELPPKLQEIVKLFQSVQEPKAKYEQLLFYGKNLKPLDTQFKTRENKVEGCVSQVWVRAFFDDEKNVVFEADSDSVLTKGLAALLVQGLSGSGLSEILRVSPDFAVLLGLQQSLTPSRNNGFLNMLKLMQKKALELSLNPEKGLGFSSDGAENEGKSLNLGGGSVENSTVEVGSNDVNSESKSGGDDGGSGDSDDLDDLGSRGKRIKEILERELSPTELNVDDVSYQHAGHAGVRGRTDGETHFNLKVVSKEFEGKSLVKRHRLIYGLLQDELQSGLHALSIVAKTPTEVDAR